MATSSVSSLGLGSDGVLSYDTIDQLREADESAILTPIDNKLTTNESKTSDLSTLTTQTQTLESVLNSLSNESTYLKRSTTVSNTAVSVTAVSGATIEDFSIHVNNLAERDIYQSNSFATSSSTFATDTTSTAGTIVAPTASTTNGVASISGATETADIAFDAAGMLSGDSLTIGGLTLTATGDMTQAEVVAAFENLNSGATTGNAVSNGTWSGTLTDFNSGAASGTNITFTSITADANVTDISASSTGSAITPTITTTDGSASTPGVTESTVVSFNVADMSAGDTLTIGGLTLTATGTMTQSEVAAAFASLSDGATSGNTVTNGTWSGTLTGFNSSAVSGTELTFTSATANSDVTDLSISATQETGGTTVSVPDEYTFTINLGGKDYTLNMTSGTTLTELVSMINDKTDDKVTASLLNVGGTDPYKLIIKSSDVGAAGAITFSSTSSSALKNLGLDSDSLTENHLQTASDASFTYNGVSITRTTNSITDLVNGATITLNEKQTDSDTQTNVSITQDLDTVKEYMSSLVTAYNDLMTSLATATKYDSDTQEAGTFQSTSQVKTLANDIKKQLLSQDNDGRSLLNYGMSLDNSGTLSFDSTEFDSLISSSAADIEDFFRGSTTYSSASYIGKTISSDALSIADGEFKINGTSITFSTSGTDAASNLVALKNAINAAGITGIEASIGSNNKIQIKSASGYDIVISGDNTKLASLGLSTSSTYSSSVTKDGFFTKFDDLLNQYVDGTDSILGLLSTRLATEKTSLTKQREKSVTALDKKYDAMATKWASYDSIISQLNTEFETLSQQIKASYTDTSS